MLRFHLCGEPDLAKIPSLRRIGSCQDSIFVENRTLLRFHLCGEPDRAKILSFWRIGPLLRIHLCGEPDLAKILSLWRIGSCQDSIFVENRTLLRFHFGAINRSLCKGKIGTASGKKYGVLSCEALILGLDNIDSKLVLHFSDLHVKKRSLTTLTRITKFHEIKIIGCDH